jgi:sporulation protein YlmC with PRC-barrel domain
MMAKDMDRNSLMTRLVCYIDNAEMYGNVSQVKTNIVTMTIDA